MKYLLNPKAGLFCPYDKEKTARNVHRLINRTAVRYKLRRMGIKR